MSKHKLTKQASGHPLIQIFLKETALGSFDLGSAWNPAFEKDLSESERLQLLTALESVCRVVANHLARTASEELGLQYKIDVAKRN